MRASGQLWIAVFCVAAPTTASDQRFQQSQVHMGSEVKVILYASDAAAAEPAFDAAFERVQELDRMMSDYDPASELSRLSKASPTTQPIQVSGPLSEVLSRAQALSHDSQGAFDITVGPLTRLWRRARRQKKMPDEVRLREARRAVGYQHLAVDSDNGTVMLHRPGMRLDLGGIAKGYAADAMLEVLSGHGIECALVNAGGDIAVTGAPPGQPGWQIGMTPLAPTEEPREFVWLHDAAVATSGDAWQYVEIDGVRYSHILDPRTGLGTTRRGGVTVIARDGVTSDSLASALSVMEVDAGLRLVEQVAGAAALIVWEKVDELRVRRSSGWDDVAGAER